MKRLVLLCSLLSLLSSKSVLGQGIMSLHLVSYPNDTFKLFINTIFPYGDGQIHYQELYSYDTVTQNDTIKLRAFYYDYGGPNLFTHYIDSINLGQVFPGQTNVLTLYPFTTKEIAPNVWDSMSFQQPDTSLLFPWISFIDDPHVSSPFSFFPNPIKDIMTINPKITTFGYGKVTISDEIGRILHRRNYTFNGSIQIDMSSYPKGYYLIEISDGRKKSTQGVIRE